MQQSNSAPYYVHKVKPGHLAVLTHSQNRLCSRARLHLQNATPFHIIMVI
jgi:hypothetical protein